jgi:serine/threonine protein kinase
MHKPRRLPPHKNISKVFGTFGSTIPEAQQNMIIKQHRGHSDDVKQKTLCIMTERYSFTLKELRNERFRSRTSMSTPLFSEVEVLYITYGIIQGLHHLYINGFIHRYVVFCYHRLLTLCIINSDLKPDNIMFECKVNDVKEVTPLILCSSRVVIINLGDCYDAGGRIGPPGINFVCDIGTLFASGGQVICA